MQDTQKSLTLGPWGLSDLSPECVQLKTISTQSGKNQISYEVIQYKEGTKYINEFSSTLKNRALFYLHNGDNDGVEIGDKKNNKHASLTFQFITVLLTHRGLQTIRKRYIYPAYSDD